MAHYTVMCGSKVGELLETLTGKNQKPKAISSQALQREGSTTIPKGSTPKWVEALTN
jgi:hypothetical protein